MKRLVLIAGVVLLLALAACDTLGPQQPVPTNTPEVLLPEGGTTGESVVPADATPTAAGVAAAPGSDLLGTTWEWVSVIDPAGQTTASDPARYTIVFNSDGTANIKADCNSVTATYSTDGASLSITPGASTAAACPEDTQDQLFVNSLSSSSSYVVQDGELLITLADGSGTMMFRGTETGEGEAPAGDTLTGVTWEWIESVTMLGATAVADPTRYQITFNEDGTANIKADCNSVMASYTTDDSGGMTITLGPTTLVACPPDSQVDQFLAELGVVGAYAFDNGDLLLRNIAADGGVTRLRAAGAVEGAGETGAPALVGSWEWVETVTPVETITAADPTRYQITFNEDGTAGIVADCNVGNATYTTGEGGTITITLGVSTLAFCVDSQDQIFRTHLAAASIYHFDGEDLLIDLFADGGTMRFRSAGAETGEGEAPAGDTLTGVTWEWIESVTMLGTTAVADPTRYQITFNEDGSANIKADCNSVMASYTTDDSGGMTITLGPTTLVACPPDSQVDQFLAELGAVGAYAFDNGDLLLRNIAADGGATRLRAAGATEEQPVQGGGAGLTGTTWQLNLIQKRDGNITINDPTRYTITFNDDGTANFQADCNVGSMTYATGEGNTLTMTPGPMTRAACPPGSLDQIYLGGLTNAMGYRLEDGNLLIDMLYESGSLVFSPAG